MYDVGKGSLDGKQHKTSCFVPYLILLRSLKPPFLPCTPERVGSHLGVTLQPGWGLAVVTPMG